MKLSELIKVLDASEVCVYEDADITNGYCGDFLSNVMGKAPSSCCWFTVMANVNVAAVAVLAEAKAVVLCEGVSPSPELVERAKNEGINLIKTDNDVFNCVLKLAPWFLG
jgi:hypothetical protein